MTLRIAEPLLDILPNPKLANSLCSLVAETDFIAAGERINLTTSIGLATSQQGTGFVLDTMLITADKLLYLAKERGPNKVVAL